MVIEDRWVLDDRTFVSLMLAVIMRERRLRSASRGKGRRAPSRCTESRTCRGCGQCRVPAESKLVVEVLKGQRVLVSQEVTLGSGAIAVLALTIPVVRLRG